MRFVLVFDFYRSIFDYFKVIPLFLAYSPLSFEIFTIIWLHFVKNVIH